MPLPAAQVLLGHASVQTIAAYGKTDLPQIREFVAELFYLLKFQFGEVQLTS